MAWYSHLQYGVDLAVCKIKLMFYEVYSIIIICTGVTKNLLLNLCNKSTKDTLLTIVEHNQLKIHYLL